LAGQTLGSRQLVVGTGPEWHRGGEKPGAPAGLGTARAG